MAQFGATRPSGDFAIASAISEAIAIGNVVDRANSNSPTLRYFQQLQQSLAQSDFRILFLAFSSRALYAGLNLIVGQDVFAGFVPPPGLTTLDLGVGRGKQYRVSLGESDRFDLEGVGELKRLLDEISSGRIVSTGTLHLRLPEDLYPALRPMRVIFPVISSDVENLQRMASSLTDVPALLILGGAANRNLSPDEKGFLRDVVTICPAIQPLVTDEEEADRRPLRPWWEDLVFSRAAYKAPAIFHASSGAAELPAILTGEENPFLAASHLSRTVRHLQLGVETLASVAAKEAGKQRTLKSREERLLRLVEGGTASSSDRKVSEGIRSVVDEGFARILKKIDEQNRLATLPNGSLNSPVAALVQSLVESDLELAESLNELKIGIRKEFVSKLVETARRQIRNQYKDDLYQVKTGVAELKEAVQQALLESSGESVSIPMPLVDEENIWRLLKESVVLEVNYKGSLPKRGWLARLGEGKQFMFTVLSLAGLAGMVFGFTRKDLGPWMMYGLPMFFIVGIGATFVMWKKEDEGKLFKEAERVREQLSSETKRLLGEAQREKLSGIREMVEGLRREFWKRVDLVVKEDQAKRTEFVGRKRNEHRERMRVFDSRAKEIQSVGTQLSRLRQSLGEMARQGSDQLKELAKGDRPA